MKVLQSIILLILVVMLSGCAALAHVLPFLGSKASNGIEVKTHVGHNKSNIGSQGNEIKHNQGTVVAARQNIRSAQTVNIHDFATSHLLVYSLVLFIAGFLIGWPISGTPQRFIRRLFGKKEIKDDGQ